MPARFGHLRHVPIHIFLTATLALFLFAPALLNAHPPPDGFLLVARSGPYGQALFGEIPPTGSASQALPGVIQRISPYFDRAPAFDGAIGDPSDQQVNAFFHALYKGQPVRGKLAVYVGNGGGSALLLFDSPALFPQSSVQMLRQASGEGIPPNNAGTASVTVEPLRQVALPGGSIGLPNGWVINDSQQGGVDAHGQGGAVSLGSRFTVPINAMQGFPGMHGPMVPPAQALMLFADSNMRGALSRGEGRITIIEQTPQATQSGAAAYVHYRTQTREFDREGLALVICSPVDYNHWQLYLSLVLADSGKFPALFPTMWAMWKSWTINPSVFRERMEEEIANMREISRIRQGTVADQQRSASNRSYAAGQLLQGVTSVEQIETQNRFDVSADGVQSLLRALNQHGEHWQEVPLDRINPAER